MRRADFPPAFVFLWTEKIYFFGLVSKHGEVSVNIVGQTKKHNGGDKDAEL